MKKYIRFGEIPENEESINFFSNEHEKGVSVFNYGFNIDNLRLASSLACRIGKKGYVVTGDEVGVGNDGEPLLKNVNIVEEYKYNNDDLSDYLYDFMVKSFKNAKGDREKDNYYLGVFYKETKKCNKCGKVVEWFIDCCDEGYTKLPSYDKYCFNGVDFTDPIEGFCCELGIKGRKFY